MSKKILVAGAGHGGIAAAALLARKGYDVTIIEKQAEQALGYDWRDCIRLSCFSQTGLEPPDDDALEPMRCIHYYNPRKSVCIPPRDEFSSASLFIERKTLIRHLIRLARESGVTLRFSCGVQRAILDGTRVTGLLTDEGEEYADLVIDAAGMDSPVRRSLPPECGVQREIAAEDTLFTYRALFEDTGESSDMPLYSAYFYHAGSKGFDWVIREKTHVDVLVGAIGGITPQIAENALRDFRADHPYLGEQLLRGGTFEKIPLRRTLPQFVCDGYAAIGNSASMIEPLSGSGLTLSIRSAGLLCDAICAAQTFTRAELWAFEQAYFRQNIRQILREETLKDVMLRLSERDLDAMFEKKIITQKEMYGGKQDADDMRHKAIGVLTTPTVIPALLPMLRRNRALPRLKDAIPQTFDADAVRAWQRAYMRF